MKISEVTGAGTFYDPKATYLHGGPEELQGQRLKRYGKNHSDSGALFFCKDTPVGRWYASLYGQKVWICRLLTPADRVFDLSNPRHRAILQRSVGPEHWASIVTSSRNGHLDWSAVDDELFEELGFRGVVFIERPAGMPTGLPPETGFAVLPEDVLSVGIFHAEDVTIVGSAERNEIASSFLKTPNSGRKPAPG